MYIYIYVYAIQNYASVVLLELANLILMYYIKVCNSHIMVTNTH